LSVERATTMSESVPTVPPREESPLFDLEPRDRAGGPVLDDHVFERIGVEQADHVDLAVREGDRLRREGERQGPGDPPQGPEDQTLPLSIVGSHFRFVSIQPRAARQEGPRSRIAP
jgi:hypothetical protein